MIKIIYARPKEKLEKHLIKTINEYDKLKNIKNIDIIIKNIINKLFEDTNTNSNLINKMIEKLLHYHDIGKVNPAFQDKLNKISNNRYTSNHSIISAIIYYDKMYDLVEEEINKIKNRRDRNEAIKYYIDILWKFAYIISRHHSNLIDYNLEYLKEEIDGILKDREYYFRDYAISDNIEDNITEPFGKVLSDNVQYKNPMDLYILLKLVDSLLCRCDFLAVYNTLNNSDFTYNVLNEEKRSKFKNIFEENEIVKNIRKYQQGKIDIDGINKYRSDMFLESEKRLNECNTNIINLEAPTGSGKTITSINLSLNDKFKNYNNIFYVAPFNVISKQTEGVLKSIISDEFKDVVTVNGRESIETDMEDWDKDLLDKQLLNYPIALISNVKLFEILFGVRRQDRLALVQLINSVIIIDEIQAYKNENWIKIINFFKEYAELLNIKFIIMSATLPKMKELLDTDYEIYDLIENRSYYYDFFKNRVDIKFDLLNKYEAMTLDNFISEFENIEREYRYKRYLIGCIKNKTSFDLYETLKEKYSPNEYNVFLLNAQSTDIYKKNVLEFINKKANGEYVNKKIILVATQTIEAGVDIDMEVGLKDIALVDSDEQFLGRIRRNFKGTGVCYFFNLDEIKHVYKDDLRRKRTLLNKECKEILINKRFDEFYKENYILLQEVKESEYKTLKDECNTIAFDYVYKSMRLIDTESCNIFLVCKYKDESGNIESSLDVFNEYKELLNEELHYAEKQIRLSKKRQELSKYIISFNIYNGVMPKGCSEDTGYYLLDLNEGNLNSYMYNMEDGRVTNKSIFDMGKYREYCNEDYEII